MMTTESDDIAMSDGPNYARMLKIIVASVIYAASLGVIIASDGDYLSGLNDGLELALIVGSAILIIIITLLWMKELGLGSKKDEPEAPSTKKARMVLLLSGVLGAALAGSFYFLQGPISGDLKLFSNGPVVPWVAIVLITTYVAGMFYASYHWERSTDEHERAAVATGLYAAVSFYSIATPSWWMAQRASLLPEQDPMIMFAMVMTVMSAAWTYKRGA